MLVLIFACLFMVPAGATVIPFDPYRSVKVTFDPCIDGYMPYSRSFSPGTGILPDSVIYSRDGYAFCGWSNEKDGKVNYDGGETVTEDMNGKTLYAVWTPLLLKSEETFTFSNSSAYFDVNGEDNYYLTPEDEKMIHTNLFKVLLPSAYPTVIVSAVLDTYPSWGWQGSCYGISTVTALEHFGYTHIRSLQNVENLAQVEPTDEVISFINYYQSQVATSYLCEHKAYKKSPEVYARLLEEMCDSVKKGNIVLFTFYQGDAVITPGHTVLFTGCYENKNGENVLIAYDSNYGSYYYYSRYINRFTVAADYSDISYFGESLGAFQWTDRFTQFESFDIGGEGHSLNWYVSFVIHLLEILNTVIHLLNR